MYSNMFKTAVAATLFASANAHFFISQPVPITGNAIKDPLDASGDNFPCHGADVTQGTVTPLTAGSTFNLQYELGGGANTAVHGGGSCQISLAYTTDATALKDPSNWKVIASFVGGCPTDAKGNLDTAAMCNGSNNPNCVNALSFKVPAEVQSGSALLAWTWFNNVGNREMYMNCAKVSISGGTNSMGSLPSMFVANLASVNQCKTTEDTNIDFPNPGAYVTKENPLNYPLQAPAGTCAAGAGSANVASSGSSSAAAAGGSSAAAPAATVAASSAAAPAATPAAASNPGGVFAPGASSAASPTATSIIATTFVTSTAPAAVATSAAAAPTAAAPATASPAAAASPAASGACSSGQVACTASGFYCISSTSFGMCNFGCAVPMPVSDGTQCASGSVSYAANYPVRRRKTISNVHRRHAAGSF